MAGIIERFINIFVKSDSANDALNSVNNNLQKVDNNTSKLSNTNAKFEQSNNRVKKSVLDNGGAMGLLGAATGGLAMDFKDAIEAIELTGISLKGLRGAIIATGIGALAILILELVTNWDKWKGVIDGSTAALKSFNAQVEINNTKREESNRLTNEAINIAENELRLMQAQGVEQDKLTAKQNEISLLKKQQAEADVITYQTELDAITALINKDDEYLDLLNELFNLKNGQTTKSLVDLQKEIDLKEEEIALYKLDNENFKTQKDLTDKLAASKLLVNTYATDPKVRAAEEKSAQLAKDKADQLKRQQEYQAKLNKLLSDYTAFNKDLISNLDSLNSKLNAEKFGAVYTETTSILKTYYDERRRQVELDAEIAKLDENTNNLEEARLISRLYEEKLKSLQTLEKVQGKVIEYVVNESNKNTAKIKFNQDIINNIKLVDDLKLKYDELSGALYDYEQILDGKGYTDYNEIINRRNLLLEKQLEIIKKTNEPQKEALKLDLSKNKSDLQEIEQQITNLTSGGRFQELEKINEAISGIKSGFGGGQTNGTGATSDWEAGTETEKKLQMDRLKSLENDRDQFMKNMSEKDYSLYKENLAKLTDLYLQRMSLSGVVSEKETELAQVEQQQSTDIEAAKLANTLNTNALKLEAHKYYISEMKALDEEYYNNLMTISTNSQSFLQQLQSDQLGFNTTWKNTILVAEKGLAIAGVVVNTIRENSKLSSLATSESSQAIASLAAQDYRGAALHSSAALKSIAGIGINKVNAGISIASILATTLTSWNHSSSGTSPSAGGVGAGGPAAQFNIVGSSANNQLAAAIASKQNQPVETYLVGTSVRTFEAMERNRLNNSRYI